MATYSEQQIYSNETKMPPLATHQNQTLFKPCLNRVRFVQLFLNAPS